MVSDIKSAHVLFIIGVTTIVIGAIDPLEGSVLIIPGSLLLSYLTYKSRDRLFIGESPYSIWYLVHVLFFLSGWHRSRLILELVVWIIDPALSTWMDPHYYIIDNQSFVCKTPKILK